MHFVTGGAFNGKRNWVSAKYPDAKWVSAYKGQDFTYDGNRVDSFSVVFEGLEEWTRNLSLEYPIDIARTHLRDVLNQWLDWEKQSSNRRVVFIGADITKGIVPIEKENRNWRDLTGWIYQDLTARCDKVDYIWYGVNKTIK